MANIQAQLDPTQPPAAPSRCRELENFYDLFIFLLHGIALASSCALLFFPPLFRAAVAPFDLHYCFCLYSKVLFSCYRRVASISHWDLHPCLCLTSFLFCCLFAQLNKRNQRKEWTEKNREIPLDCSNGGSLWISFNCYWKNIENSLVFTT